MSERTCLGCSTWTAEVDAGTLLCPSCTIKVRPDLLDRLQRARWNIRKWTPERAAEHKAAWEAVRESLGKE